MRLLKCKLCGGECEFVGNEHTVQRKVRCLQCGFNNLDEEKKGPEVIIRKRPQNDTNQ